MLRSESRLYFSARYRNFPEDNDSDSWVILERAIAKIIKSSRPSL